MIDSPNATQVLEAQNALMGAARKLAAMPELQEKLFNFINCWGFDGWEPDEETRATVINIVHGLIASANALKEISDD